MRFLYFLTLLCFAQATYLPTESHKEWATIQSTETLPLSWNWGNVNGTNYLTKNLNQHIPQYCGSCWAHGAVSAFGDRIKIARNATHPDINLSVQFLLNCGDAGTCRGGDPLRAYRYIKKKGGIPFDTCLIYEACSYDSSEKVCNNRNFSCIPRNICRTCTSLWSSGTTCVEIYPYPNATVKDYYALKGYENMMKEIYERGPIACGMNSRAVENYTGGILDLPNASRELDHVISIVGWGNDGKKSYWIIRNSWGEYWGEMGFFRIVLGENQLGLEDDCSVVIPDKWTEHNKPCVLDGSDCQGN